MAVAVVMSMLMPVVMAILMVMMIVIVVLGTVPLRSLRHWPASSRSCLESDDGVKIGPMLRRRHGVSGHRDFAVHRNGPSC
ncbi:hypothetical protein TSH58p_14620 [Azospirillum sp. TSH58]|nr:hypothetical protein TSH58p_14620 [Azospirillum sp. TSH58]PWC80737.1 hypothetical protein TSH58_01380 [Azospirillum sp. TSH58]